MSAIAGIGWSDRRTATGAKRRRLRDRGRPIPGKKDCVCCMNARVLWEYQTMASGTRYLIPVVCRFCDDKE